MSSCETIKKRKRNVCVGNMRDVITLQNRNITPPIFNTVDFDEDFQPIDNVTPDRYSLIETSTGKTFFDGVGTDVPITHLVYIRFDATVTAETWIEFEGRRFDILKVEDLEERHKYMKLTCTDRGLVNREASKA